MALAGERPMAAASLPSRPDAAGAPSLPASVLGLITVLAMAAWAVRRRTALMRAAAAEWRREEGELQRGWCAAELASDYHEYRGS